MSAIVQHGLGGTEDRLAPDLRLQVKVSSLLQEGDKRCRTRADVLYRLEILKLGVKDRPERTKSTEERSCAWLDVTARNGKRQEQLQDLIIVKPG